MMEMNEVINLLPALFAGIILGVLFFGGLWYTVRLGMRSNKSSVIFIGSFILRMAIVLLGFYYVGANNWQKMLACLGGFLIARMVITRIQKKDIQTKATFIKEASNET